MASAALQTPLSKFKVLSFDIYGTLIDWESGIMDSLKPLLSSLPPETSVPDRHTVLTLFTAHEGGIQREQPTMPYSDVLSQAYYRLAAYDLGVAETSLADGKAFAAALASWPAFPDTVAALHKLRALGYKLVPLSNVDRSSLSTTLAGPLLPVGGFDAVYTAQDIGSYKPDSRNFEYLLEHVRADFGVGKEALLHVAQSLKHDHVPAKAMGLSSVWIARGEDGKSAMGGRIEDLADQVGFGWRFGSLGEFAEACERDFHHEAT